MQCAEFEERLHGALDRRLAPEADPHLAAHAESCGTCRSVLVAQKQLLSTLKPPITEPSAAFAPSVLDHVLVTQRRSRRRRRIVLAIATAAVLMLAVLPFVGNRPQIVEQGGRSPRVVGLAVVPPRAARSRLSEEEEREFRLLIRSLMVEISERRLQAFEPVDHLASGFRPLAVTFNVAFDALLKTLPGQRSSRGGELPQAVFRAGSAPVI